MIPERNSASLWFDCSIDEFRAELDWLIAHGAHFITVDQLYQHLSRGSSLPPHPICITFADNYLGFIKYAYPMLKRRQIPCAMFVHTGFVGSPIGRPKMNWNQLEQLDRENLVSIQSQTVSHPLDLRRVSSSKLQVEMTRSRSDLRAHLHRQIAYVAYPNGKFNLSSEEAARKAGYLMAFSEALTPAEASPSLFSVARYVHTKFKRAWRDANR